VFEANRLWNNSIPGLRVIKKKKKANPPGAGPPESLKESTNPKPYTLNPALCTLNPKPYTLNSKTLTLYPNPKP
jgi:hypothetical protein